MAMLKRQKIDPLVQVNVSMTAKQKRKLEAQARRFANGNVSAWIRYSALELEARPEDLVG